MFERFNSASRNGAPLAEPAKTARAGDVGSVSLELKVSLHQRLIDKINLAALEKMTRAQVAEQLNPIVTRMITEERTALNRSEYERLLEELLDEVLGLGPLEPLLNDNSIADILV